MTDKEKEQKKLEKMATAFLRKNDPTGYRKLKKSRKAGSKEYINRKKDYEPIN